MPYLTTYKSYAILSPTKPVEIWHIGYMARGVCEINKLPLKSDKIKMLTGSKDETVAFFGYDPINKKHIPLKLIDTGKTRDKKHKKVRLL